MKKLTSLLGRRVRSVISQSGGRLALAGLLLLAPAMLRAANISKTDDANALNLGSSWTGGVVPGLADVGVFDSTITATRTPNLGANANWLGLKLTNPGGAVTIGNTPAAILTLGASGIDMSSATTNLTLSCGLALSGDQNWKVASGETLDASAISATNLSGAVNFYSDGVAGTIKLGNTQVNGIIGGWAYTPQTGGSPDFTWANSASTVVGKYPEASYDTTWSASVTPATPSTKNESVSTSFLAPALVTFNSLRFTATAAISGGNSVGGTPQFGVGSGGIMVVNNATATLESSSSTAGRFVQCTTAGAPLYITVTGTGTMNIGVAGFKNQLNINDNGGTALVKAGSGTFNYNVNTTAASILCTGLIYINEGKMVVIGNASMTAPSGFQIGGGATFDVSGLSIPLTNGNTQSLIGSGTTSSGTIAVLSGKGLTMGATSPLKFTAFNGTTAPLTVSGASAGSLVLAAGNPVTVTVANGGFPLSGTLGGTDYKLIAKSGSATVSGTAPTSVTVNGDGIVGSSVASLVISNSELYLRVTATCTPPADQTFTSTGDNGTTGHYCTGGSGITIGLAGSEGSPIQYRLLLGGADLGNVQAGTGSTVSFGAQTAAGVYRVLATNTTTSCTLLLSGSVTVTVDTATTAPTPADQIACNGSGTATFTIAPGGTGPFTYQWQTNNGGGYVSVGSGSGGQAAAYTTPVVNGTYEGLLVRCVVNGTCGSAATSAPATLHVSSGPTGGTVASMTRALGEVASFIVTGTAGVSPAYQWETNNGGGYVSVGSANGGTTTNYTISAVVAGYNGLLVHCVVSSSCGSAATSTAATLTVVPGDYRSAAASGSWTVSPATAWQINRHDGNGFVAATIAPSDSNSTNIVIQAGHTMTVAGSATADQLTVNATGVLNISGGTFTIASGGGAPDCDVFGTILQTGGTLTPTGTLTFENGGQFLDSVPNVVAIPTATWADGSTCKYNGANTAAITATGISGQSFYDLTYDTSTSGQSSNVKFNIQGTATTVRHNLSVTNQSGVSCKTYLCDGNGILTVGNNMSLNSGVSSANDKILLVDVNGSVFTNKVGGSFTAVGYLDGFAGAGTAITIEFTGTGTLTLPTGVNLNNGTFISYQVDNGVVTTLGSAVTTCKAFTNNGTLNFNTSQINGGNLGVGATGTIVGNGTNKLATGLASMVYGGTLNINQSLPTFAGGDNFQLFGATTYTINTIVINPTPPPGGASWDYTTTPGTFIVVGTGSSSPVLGVSQSGSTLTFSWTGLFKLQSQTNNLGTGLSGTWFDYPGGSTSPVPVTIDPANPTVFYRLMNQ